MFRDFDPGRAARPAHERMFAGSPVAEGFVPHFKGIFRTEVIMEKREHMRKHTKSLVDFATRGWTYLRSIDNISAGGMFIRTRDIIEPGEELYMRFSVEGKRHDLKGRVAWTAENGIGVRFLSEGA